VAQLGINIILYFCGVKLLSKNLKMIQRFIGAIIVLVGAISMSYVVSLQVWVASSGNAVFRSFLCGCTFLTLFFMIIYLAFFLAKDRI